MNCRLPVKEGHPMGKRFALPSPAFEVPTFHSHPFVTHGSLFAHARTPLARLGSAAACRASPALRNDIAPGEASQFTRE